MEKKQIDNKPDQLSDQLNWKTGKVEREREIETTIDDIITGVGLVQFGLV